MKLYMFWRVRLSIIRSLFTVHSAMVYVMQVCRQLSSRSRMELQFHPDPARKLSTNLLWHIPLLSVPWINSWWWTDELSEICRVSWQNKFVKLVHLVGFITKKFVTMHHHMNVKFPKSHWLGEYQGIIEIHEYTKVVKAMGLSGSNCTTSL